MLEWLASAAPAALNLLLPYHCLVCSRGLQRSALCSACSTLIPILSATSRCDLCFNPSERSPCTICETTDLVFRRQRFVWDFSDTFHRLLLTLKYRPSARLAKYVAKRSAPFIVTLFPAPAWDIIVPIPASYPSFKQRLFNPAGLFASTIAHEIGDARLDCRALSHLGTRFPQASLPHRQRAANVRHAFAASPQLVRRKSVLLVDDLVTTGATTAAAARCLRDAGASVVDLVSLSKCLTIAHSRLQTLRF